MKLEQISDEYIKEVNGIKCRFAKFKNELNQVVEINISKSHGKHKRSGSRIYDIWKGMRHRCTNPNRPGYKYYGLKGIKVCDEWNNENGFENFYEWSIDNGYADYLTIDRLDSNKDYQPDNCQWVTHLENTTKATKQKHLPTFEYIGINQMECLMVKFYKVKDFAKMFGIDSRRVSDCCTGARQDYKGWTFTRKEIDVFETQETIQYWSTMEGEFPLEVQSISRR